MGFLNRGLLCSSLILASIASRSVGDNGWEGRILSFTEENDAIFHTDRHYTQGAVISFLSGDEALPGWLATVSDALPTIGFRSEARKFGIAAGQEIYTPANLQISSLITDDRPYAGWLFAAFTLQRRGEASKTWQALENLRLELGVIGPESFAADAQKTTHQDRPEGWSNQLGTEVGFALRYDRRYLYRLQLQEDRWALDVIPSVSVSGGTVATFAGLGSMMRVGYHIPNEFETPKQPTPLGYGEFAFAGADGRYVVRNIFLDGNTFHASPHISKQPWVADFRGGLTIVLKSVELTGAATLRTREFHGQKNNDPFGTATLTWKI